MTSKLGVYWSVMHRRPQDYTYFKGLNPSVIKLMDGGQPDYAFAKDNLPNTLVISRDWALSEQHSDMLRDPVGTGQRHAREWNEHQPKLGFDRAKTLILGINEPTVWEAGFPEALRQYTIALCGEAKKYGLRVGAMQLGVGWPGNNGPDTPPDWSPFHGVEQAILDNGGALVTHEYWADKGPSENWGWWAGRTLKCPWQVPIVIGECGVDMFVKDTSVGQQNRGWLGHMPPERYAAELWAYTIQMSQDPRFAGCCVFASDFAAHEWYSFDVEPAYKAILAVKPADTKPPVDTYLPAIGTGKSKPAYIAVPSGANLRKAPNVTADIIMAIPYGKEILVYLDEVSHNWSLVEYQGNSGYMNSSLFSFTKPPELTPVPPPAVAPTPSPSGKLIWPVAGPITQYFGAHDIAYPGLPGHDGLDFGVPEGTPALAVADGKVMMVDNDPIGFGLYVRIFHPAHGFHSMLGHLSKQLVTPGQIVKQGQKVALSGNTGNSTGPHLHYSTRLGSETAYYDLHDGYRNGCANPLAVYALVNGKAVTP